MKKIISILLLLALFVFPLCSCGAAQGQDGRLSVVCTVFPIYDWARNIIGENNENVDLTLLLDSGVDLHSYQPTIADIALVCSCDIFIYVGGESDVWVDDALKQSQNPGQTVIDLLDVLGDFVKEEELVEGMQGEEEEGGEPEYDEHVWLSLKAAVTLCRSIGEKLSAADAEHADSYSANLSSYISKLSALDSRYESAVENAKYDTLLFADRFPFRYLCDDYGLKYYAAFVGCSAESEASFETIAFLARKLDELKLGGVLIIDGSDGSIAKTVISNTADKKQTVLTLNSMQSVTQRDIENGADYYKIMESNLSVLTQALN